MSGYIGFLLPKATFSFSVQMFTINRKHNFFAGNEKSLEIKLTDLNFFFFCLVLREDISIPEMPKSGPALHRKMSEVNEYGSNPMGKKRQFYLRKMCTKSGRYKQNIINFCRRPWDVQPRAVRPVHSMLMRTSPPCPLSLLVLLCPSLSLGAPSRSPRVRFGLSIFLKSFSNHSEKKSPKR